MKLFSYKKFLMNEQTKNQPNEMVYSDDFVDVLSRIDDKVSKDLIKLKDSKNVLTHIDITDKNDFISFIQRRNIKELKDPWETSARQELKIGKFARKLLGKDVPNKEIEDFVNQYKASYEFEQYENRFEIVEGDDITKYYLCSNQIYGGQLGKSCMGTRDQQKFIKSFYKSNSQSIKMLILRDKDEPKKILGRANLWYLDNLSGRIFMDRIYTSQDYLINIFIQYAEINDYIYKSRQIYGGNVVPVIDKGQSEKIIMSTHMNNKKYKYYPYVDTLQFFNKETGEITNDTSKWDLTEGDSDWIALIHAGGSYLTKDNDNGFKMDYMGRLVHPYFVKWSKIDNCYIHTNDAIYLSYKDDFCVPERDIVQIDGYNYLKEDANFDEESKIYKIKK